MKTRKIIIALISVVLICTPVFKTLAQHHGSTYEKEHAKVEKKTETFGVSGNCGMCKKTIESAVKKDKAIISAKWNETTKKLTVTYDPEKINIDKIHQLVANAGYDTDKIEAKDEVYNSLPGCCKYERQK